MGTHSSNAHLCNSRELCVKRLDRYVEYWHRNWNKNSVDNFTYDQSSILHNVDFLLVWFHIRNNVAFVGRGCICCISDLFWLLSLCYVVVSCLITARNVLSYCFAACISYTFTDVHIIWTALSNVQLSIYLRHVSFV